MQRIKFAIITFLMAANIACGQSAKQILDKAAAAISNKSGITASFVLKGGKMNDKGNISIKGKKFYASTPDVVIWFDGKTQWTYVKKNDEVNVSTPTDSQLQLLNPYNFIYMYKRGYNYTLTKRGASYEIHLKAIDNKQSIQEMYLTVNSKTYIPSQIRVKHIKGWNTIDVSNFKKVNLSETIFHFNPKDYPQVEVIDLR